MVGLPGGKSFKMCVGDGGGVPQLLPMYKAAMVILIMMFGSFE